MNKKHPKPAKRQTPPPSTYREPRLPSGWRREHVRTMDLQGLSDAMPVKRVTPLARPGMTVRLCNQLSDVGQILHCLAEACVVRGCRGEVCAIAWGEVDLIGVVPDPDWTIPPEAFHATTDRKPAKSRKAKDPKSPAHFPRIAFDNAARV